MRRAPGRTGHNGPTVFRAVLCSGAVHLLALLAIVGLSRGRDPRLPLGLALPDVDPPWLATDDVEVELAGEEAFDLSAAPPLPAVPEPRPRLPLGDLATAELAPRQGPDTDSDERQRPAPDDGAGAGRPAEVAFRRDASTLHARLSDGARVDRPSRERTGPRASSPQAIRREPRVGVGDSSATRQASNESTQVTKVTLPEEGFDDETEPVPPPVAIAAATPGDAVVRGVGPLSAEAGPKAFDATQAGAPMEVVHARAAASEVNPGVVDFSAPSASHAAGVVGSGPGDAPGVINERRPGSAPSLRGGQPIPSPIGAVGEASDERVYFREHLEIRQRVTRALRFPRRLAIMLEQGEAVVVFRVERNGHVAGEVKLIKSAGFEEFDREAIDVVRRAAPFPVLPKVLLVRMPIAFENPVIR